MVLSILITISVLLAATVAAGALWLASVNGRTSVVDAEGNKVDMDLAPKIADEPYTVLILGYDDDEWGTSRSDTIMLARIDEKAGKVWLLSLPRDIRVDIPGYGYQKLNAAFALGGPQLAVQTVEGMTDIRINHYMGMEMMGFVDVVDALGGVQIDVPFYIEAGGELWEQPIQPGLQTLDGWQSLWFVRTRYQFTDQDIQRTKNQQYFLKALAEQAAHTPITKIVSVVDAVSNMVQSDMNLVELVRMARALQSVGADNIYTATAPGEWQEPYLLLTEPDFGHLIRRLMNGMPIGEDEDDAVEGSGGFGPGAENLIPQLVSVDIRNGSSRSGLAAQASSLLQSSGFLVGEVGNVQNPGAYYQTVVIYKERREAADLVASYLQPGVEIRPSDGAYVFEGDVLIVIGSDWDLGSVPLSQNQ